VPVSDPSPPLSPKFSLSPAQPSPLSKPIPIPQALKLDLDVKLNDLKDLASSIFNKPNNPNNPNNPTSTTDTKSQNSTSPNNPNNPADRQDDSDNHAKKCGIGESNNIISSLNNPNNPSPALPSLSPPSEGSENSSAGTGLSVLESEGSEKIKLKKDSMVNFLPTNPTHPNKLSNPYSIVMYVYVCIYRQGYPRHVSIRTSYGLI